MKIFKSLLALLSILLWIGAAAAETSLDLRLPVGRSSISMMVIEQMTSERRNISSYEERCYGTANLIFGHSAHPGGDFGGRLNQNNGGHGGRCYFDPRKSFYGTVLGIQNSQYGNTLVLAVGKRWTVTDLNTDWLDVARIPIKRARLFIGAEAGTIYYEKRAGRGAVFGPFIFPNIAGSLQIGSVEITAMQVYLPQGIKLWGHAIEVPPDVFGGYQAYQGLPGNEFVSTQGRSQLRPTIFINYRF